MSWRLIKWVETPWEKYEPQILPVEYPEGMEPLYILRPSKGGHFMQFSESELKSMPEWFAQDLPDGWMRPDDASGVMYAWILSKSGKMYLVQRGNDNGWDVPGDIAQFGKNHIVAIKPIEKPEPPKI